MDFKQLQYFLAVVEHRSFRKAADALNVSQPALSIALKRLEESLSCRLLDRTPGRVVPTAFGASLAESARRIQQEVKIAEDRLAEIHGIARGRVAVGVSPYAFTAELGALIGDFVHEYPGLELRTRIETYESALPMLLRDDLDFFIAEVVDRPRPPHAAYTVLYRNPYVVVTRPGHPLAARRSVRPAQLAACPWIYGTDMVRQVKNWAATFRAEGLEPPAPVVAGGDLEFHENLLRSSDFLAALPLTLVQASLAEGRLVELRLPGITWYNDMDIVYRDDISLSPGAKRLFDEVLTRLRTDTEQPAPRAGRKRGYSPPKR